jgi:hypothetical protein
MVILRLLCYVPRSPDGEPPRDQHIRRIHATPRRTGVPRSAERKPVILRTQTNVAWIVLVVMFTGLHPGGCRPLLHELAWTTLPVMGLGRPPSALRFTAPGRTAPASGRTEDLPVAREPQVLGTGSKVSVCQRSPTRSSDRSLGRERQRVAGRIAVTWAGILTARSSTVAVYLRACYELWAGSFGSGCGGEVAVWKGLEHRWVLRAGCG